MHAYTDYGPVVRTTFLIGADPHVAVDLEALAPTGSRAGGRGEAGADGTYPDLESRAAVVVRDGAIVGTHVP